ncbi:MAG: aromatic-ring-hydroxylating dioxygenase subunit beta [Silvibacterium sp.]|nr:aromatic-ring-hydroxylating dioxygenase subunit beta [Silvibacterium sp.]
MSNQTQWQRAEVEDFLYAEMAYLDEWKLDDWFKLFTEDCTYVVPTTDRPDGDPARDMVFIDDNHLRLEGRVRKLKSQMAHREVPRSRTRHVVTNVRIVDVTDGDAVVEACFVIYRFKGANKEPYVGQYRYRLTRQDGNIMIRHRRATLDLETLRDQGAVSIIL